jgi:hypothetical protein
MLDAPAVVAVVLRSGWLKSVRASPSRRAAARVGAPVRSSPRSCSRGCWSADLRPSRASLVELFSVDLCGAGSCSTLALWVGGGVLTAPPDGAFD